MEKAGHVSERCKINRQIRVDNALIHAMKATIVKLKKAVETTIPAIAAAMETVRQNIIVFQYGVLFVRGRRKDTKEYVEKATHEYGEYKNIRRQIKGKLDERKKLQQELDGLSVFSLRKRKDLSAKIKELTQEIGELQFQEKSIMEMFEKKDAKGMKQVAGEISKSEKRIEDLDAQEGEFTGAINREKEKFDGLKEQAADLDPYELTDARLALRPQMERTARERIRSGLSSGKIGFWGYECSIRDADTLLREEDMAQRHEEQKRRRKREITCEPQKRKPRSHEWDR